MIRTHMFTIHTPTETILATEWPRWNSFWNRYYVHGYRLIRTKGKFSAVLGLHNFTAFKL